MADLRAYTGRRVRHPEYGPGTILRVQGDELVVHFDEDNTDGYFATDSIGKELIPGGRAAHKDAEGPPDICPPIATVINQHVRHKKYGSGTIISVEKNVLTVKFDTKTQKQFVYPGCMGNFLEFKQPETLDAYAAQYFQHKDRRHLSRPLDVPACSSLRQFNDLFVPALDSEVQFIHKNGSSRRKLSNGRLLTPAGTERWSYIFEASSELQIPPDTAVMLYEGTTLIAEAVVVACESFNIVLEVDRNLGKEVSALELEADTTVLLRNLCSRLDEMRAEPQSIAKILCTEGFARALGTDIAQGQEQALAMAQSQPITIIWGPPGTGKTKVLADIALAHMRVGHRVLILSHSNVAVDSAALRVLAARPDLAPGQVVRYGYPRMKQVMDHPHLTSYCLALLKHPEINNTRKSLLQTREGLKPDDPEYISINRALSELREQLKKHERSLIASAPCIATTLAKAAADSAIYEQTYDVVIVDEASMAYVPQLVFAASLATRNFVCVGDFSQLPPIVQNDAEGSPLKLDIFRFCGISSSVQNRLGHEWLCLLNKQYRMDPTRADFVSRQMYQGRLKSAPVAAQRTQRLITVQPFAGSSFGLLDLSGAMSTCVRVDGASRLNVLSALYSLELAHQLAASGTVGIISPFRAQADFLHALLLDAQEAGEDWSKAISCATVHQFQGSEMDHIVFDVAECYRSQYLSRLLQSADDSADRLMNVAMTRARGKFIVVANCAFLQRCGLRADSMLGALMARFRPADTLDPEDMHVKAGDNPSAWQRWGTEADSMRSFLNDLRGAEKSIHFDIPAVPAASARNVKAVASALKYAQKRDVSVRIRGELPDSVPSSWQSMSFVDKSAMNPVVLVDNKKLWFGLPASAAEFHQGGARLHTRFRPVIRLEGARTCQALSAAFDMDRQRVTGRNGRFAAYVAAHCVCSQCGRALQLRSRTSRRTSFFLGCSGFAGNKCRATKKIDQKLIADYLDQGDAGACPVCKEQLHVEQVRDSFYVACASGNHRFNLLEI